jgi:hypothetical protein
MREQRLHRVSDLGDSEHSQGTSPVKEARGGERQPVRDQRQVSGTDRTAGGTELYTDQVFWVGLAVQGVIVAVVNTLDVLSTMRMRPEYGVLRPILWEATAGATILLAALIPWALLRYAAIDKRPLWQAAIVTVLCAPLFSVVHVLSFVALRMAIYAADGLRYDFGPVIPGFEYEASRDIFGYVGAFLTFWLAARYLQRQQTPVPGQRLFDIRDGARLIRVPINDILAVCSAGNYVEFVLRDGRKPLMRKPLSSLEAEFMADGFVRTHRSWLVNAMQVTGLRPGGSGDYEVELGSVTAPLSRRFPDALAKLRAG